MRKSDKYKVEDMKICLSEQTVNTLLDSCDPANIVMDKEDETWEILEKARAELSMPADENGRLTLSSDVFDWVISELEWYMTDWKNYQK